MAPKWHVLAAIVLIFCALDVALYGRNAVLPIVVVLGAVVWKVYDIRHPR